MKQTFLIIGIIFCSLISGYIGAQLPHLGISSPLEERRAANDIVMKDISFLENIEKNITKTVENSSPSVVSIIIKKDMVVYRSDPWGFFHRPIGSALQTVGGGSGFFIRKDGIILTNKHVVSDRDAQYTVMLSDGTEYDGEVLAYVRGSDLALIQISHSTGDNFIPLKMQEASADASIGSFVIAIGNALAEFQNSVSLGILSGKNRSIQAGGKTLSGLLQTDAAINPGNSGGPLIGLDGTVIGVNTAIVAGSNGIGFAIEIDSEMIESLLSEL